MCDVILECRTSAHITAKCSCDGMTELSFILNSLCFACAVICKPSDSHAKTDTVAGATSHFTAYWLRYAPTSLRFKICTLCPHLIYVFCIYLRTNSDSCHLQHKLIGFYNRDEGVHCAVRTGSLNKAVCASSLKG